MLAIIKKIFGTANDRELKRLRPRAVRINDLEPRIKALSDAQLRGMTAEFRQKLDNLRGAIVLHKVDAIEPFEQFALLAEL